MKNSAFSEEQNLTSSNSILESYTCSILLLLLYGRSFDTLASVILLVQLWLADYPSNEVQGKRSQCKVELKQL